jgi:hypothetical protein
MYKYDFRLKVLDMEENILSKENYLGINQIVIMFVINFRKYSLIFGDLFHFSVIITKGAFERGLVLHHGASGE